MELSLDEEFEIIYYINNNELYQKRGRVIVKYKHFYIMAYYRPDNNGWHIIPFESDQIPDITENITKILEKTSKKR